jgi:copper chaperone CopZ
MASENEKIMKITLNIEGMHCASCAQTIEKGLYKLNGIEKANVNFLLGKAYVEYNPRTIREDQFEKTIHDLGYKLIGKSKAEEKEKKVKTKTEIIKPPKKRIHIAKMWADYSKEDSVRMGREAEAFIPQLQRIAESNLKYKNAAEKLIKTYEPVEKNRFLRLFKRGKRALKIGRFNQLAYENKDCVALARIINYLEWYGFSFDLENMTAKKDDLTFELIIDKKQVLAINKDSREDYAKIEF